MARLAIARGFLAEYAQLDKGTQVAVRAMIAQFASPGDVGQYLESATGQLGLPHPHRPGGQLVVRRRAGPPGRGHVLLDHGAPV